jgi:hypothetical protein
MITNLKKKSGAPEILFRAGDLALWESGLGDDTATSNRQL